MTASTRAWQSTIVRIRVVPGGWIEVVRVVKAADVGWQAVSWRSMDGFDNLAIDVGG